LEDQDNRGDDHHARLEKLEEELLRKERELEAAKRKELMDSINAYLN